MDSIFISSKNPISNKSKLRLYLTERIKLESKEIALVSLLIYYTEKY